MSATGLLLAIIAIFIIINAINIVDVFRGKTSFRFTVGELRHPEDIES